MKPIRIAAALALLFTASAARAQNSVNLQWDRNPEPDIAGYKVYQKVITPAPGPIGGTTPPPAITWKLLGQTAPAVVEFKTENVPDGVTVYAVTAFNASKESGRSNEVTVTFSPAPSNPKNARVKTVTVTP